MTLKDHLIEFVGEANLSEAEVDCEAYSIDASTLSAYPLIVVWPPNDPEKISYLVKYANRINTPITLRGKGKGITGGAIGEGIILDLSRHTKISRLSVKDSWVEARAGTTIQELNTVLREQSLFFPCIPLPSTHTLGGLISLNPIYYGQSYFGPLKNYLLEAEGVEGTGQHPDLDPEAILGTEGTTAIILSLKLKTTELVVQRSLSLSEFDELPVALNAISDIKKRKDLIGITLTAGAASDIVGSQKSYAVLAEFASDHGEIQDLSTFAVAESRFKNIISLLSERSYLFVEDAKLELEKLFDLEQWCFKKSLPLVCWPDLGVAFVKFTREQEKLRDQFRILIKKLNGELGCCFGHGRLKKKFVSGYKSNRVFRLKERMDYNNILGRGVIIDYK